MSRTGYIYEIKSIDKSITETYIGSTWDMKDRQRDHVSRCYNKNTSKYNYSVYKYIRENGDWDNFQMTVIDFGECEDELELHCAEQFYIDMEGGIENLLNSRDALRDKQKRKEKTEVRRDRLQKENKETKRFPCELCGIYCVTKCHLVTHLETNKHKKKLSQLS